MEHECIEDNSAAVSTQSAQAASLCKLGMEDVDAGSSIHNLPKEQTTQPAKKPRTRKPRPKRTSHLKDNILQLTGVVNSLSSEARRLQLVNNQLKTKLPAVLAKVIQLPGSALSRQSALLQFNQDKIEASMAAIPPTTHWTPAVLRYFENMSMEQYRFLYRDVVHQVQQHLPEALFHGSGHPSCNQIEQLLLSGAAMVQYVLHNNKQPVVLINAARNMETGDYTDGPPDNWFATVAESFPLEEMLSPASLECLMACTGTYLAGMRQIQAERQRLKRLLAELIPTTQAAGGGQQQASKQSSGTLLLHGSLASHQSGPQQPQLYRESDSWRITEALASLAEQDSREAAQRAAMLAAGSTKVLPPVVGASLIAACYPYTLNMAAMLLSFRTMLERRPRRKCEAWTAS